MAEQLKAYLTYPNDGVTAGLLLVEKWENDYILTLNGKSIKVSHQTNENLRRDIENVGGTVKTTERLRLRGATRVFNVPVTVQLIKSIGVDVIRVRVVGYSIDELMGNISKIKDGLWAYGYKPKTCTWKLIGTLDSE